MKNRLRIVTSACVASAFILAGCASYDKSTVTQNRPETGPTDTWGRAWGGPDAVAESKSAPATVSGAGIRTHLMHVVKRVPSEVVLGEEFCYDITATALEDSGNIIVTDEIPAGATYVKSEPPAQVAGNQLVWKFPAMNKGDKKDIKVCLRADKEGALASCYTVSADPKACTSIVVGKPSLAIVKSGPEKAQLNSDVTYNIVVSNNGTAAAKNVVVTDTLPDGLVGATGQTQTFNVGDLAPGQSKNIPVTAKAAKRGRFCNNATAQSSNAGRVSAEACTVVTERGIAIVKTGAKEQYSRKNANYEIVVTNTGDEALAGVVVTDTAPAGTRIVAAPGATVNGNTATWNVGTLAAGEKKPFTVTLTADMAGNYCNTASVASSEGLTGTAEACTLWKGYAGLLLEMIDTVDPIQVGEGTDYVVTITNQGSADDTNVKADMMFPAEVEPISGSGDSAVTVDGRKVSFAVYPRLAPKQAIRWTVKAKGAIIGDARTRVWYTSDLVKTPVNKEESTHVY